MNRAIDLSVVDGGRACVLAVRAQPGSKRAGIAGVWNGMLKVAVTAPPEDGRANESVAAVIAEAFGLRRAEVELVSGARARIKKFRLAADPSAVRDRLAELGI